MDRPQHADDRDRTNDMSTEIPIYELGVAQLEYFIDIGVDDDGRIQRRLERSDTTLRFNFETSTDAVLTPLWDHHNAIESQNSVPVTVFKVHGTIKHSPSFSPSSISLEVHSDTPNDSTSHPPMQLLSDDLGNILISSKDENDVTVLTPLEFIDFTLRASSIDQMSRESILATLRTIDHDYYKQLSAGYWEALAQRSGGVRRRQSACQLLTSYSDGLVRRGKLVYESFEDAKSNGLKIILEHVIEYPDIDAEEAYVLEITFDDPLSEDRIQRDAKKIVLSGVDPGSITSIRAQLNTSGRKTELNLKDPEIMGLFVDTFDEIICGSNN